MEKQRIYLTGGWGYGNLGDDAILSATLQELNRCFPNADIAVTSFKPNETDGLHGLKCKTSVHAALTPRRLNFLPRMITFILWWAMRKRRWSNMLLPRELREHLALIGSSDVVVMGGGGYFNDRWYTALPARFAEIAFATASNTPIVIAGQTVGPFSATFSKILMPRIFSAFALIMYRDKQSRLVLERHKAAAEKLEWTADQATLLTAERKGDSSEDVARPLRVGVMIQKFRPYESANGTVPLRAVRSSEEYEKIAVTALIEIWTKHQCSFVFVPSTGWDRTFCEKIANNVRASTTADVSILDDHSFTRFKAICQGVDLMISTNMHPIILASTAGKPSIGISYFYKMDDFLEDIGSADTLFYIDQISADAIVNRFDEILANRSTRSQMITQRMEIVKSRARRNVENLSRFFSRP